MTSTRRIRVLSLEEARAARLERMAEELRDELHAMSEITRLQKRVYAECATTGGKPPSECRAPLPKETMSRRRAKLVEKKKTRDNYRYYLSTGCRPPHECRAPVRRLSDEESSEDEVDSDELSSDDDESNTTDFCITISPKKRVKNTK